LTAFQDLQFKTNETRALIAQGEATKKINAQVW
uniref:Homeobox domain-containing protein n=1 Tax=Heligmosomoides polygyrus TaxID=6339 RepID=A0A183FB12_HELPZ